MGAWTGRAPGGGDLGGGAAGAAGRIPNLRASGLEERRATPEGGRWTLTPDVAASHLRRRRHHGRPAVHARSTISSHRPGQHPHALLRPGVTSCCPGARSPLPSRPRRPQASGGAPRDRARRWAPPWRGRPRGAESETKASRRLSPTGHRRFRAAVVAELGGTSGTSGCGQKAGAAEDLSGRFTDPLRRDGAPRRRPVPRSLLTRGRRRSSPGSTGGHGGSDGRRGKARRARVRWIVIALIVGALVVRRGSFPGRSGGVVQSGWRTVVWGACSTAPSTSRRARLRARLRPHHRAARLRASLGR